MKPKPPRDRAASVRQRLLNIAKERGEEFNFILLRYGLERLLFRLGESRYAGTFVLKGAMLFPLWSGSPHRATKDMDVLGAGPPDIARFVDIFREVAAADNIRRTRAYARNVIRRLKVVWPGLESAIDDSNRRAS